MSDVIPPSPGDDTYRPISGMALAGLALSAGFAGLVLLSAGVAVVQGAPIFYPMWILLMPIAGFVMCLIGRNQILASEGTRAGLNLAKWGMVLALFSGLGYSAYFTTVGLAVAKQADEFIAGPAEPDSGFLAHLKRGGKSPIDLDIAFLLTRPATGRIKVRTADDEALIGEFDRPGPDASAGELTKFRGLPLVRMMARAGDDAGIEPLGSRDWSYDKASYKVSRGYRLTTPEAVLDIVFQIESTDAEAEGRLRQWFVNLNRSPTTAKTLTPLGKAVEQVRDQAFQYIDRVWRAKMHAGEFKDTPPRDDSDWAKLFPDIAENIRGGKNVYRPYFKSGLRDLLTGQGAQTFTPSFELGSWPVWGMEQDRMWIDIPIKMMLAGSGEIATVSAEGTLRMQTREPFDPAKAATPIPPLQWDAVSVKVSRVRAVKND